MRGSLWRKAFTCSDCKRKFVPKNDLREHENRRKASFHQHWSDGFSEYLEAQLLPSESGHSVSLFTRGKLSKFPMTSNHRQNCSIGQLISKKCFFRRVSLDPGENARESRGRSGASWRHLEAPHSPEKKIYYKNFFSLPTFVSKFFQFLYSKN